VNQPLRYEFRMNPFLSGTNSSLWEKMWYYDNGTVTLWTSGLSTPKPDRALV